MKKFILIVSVLLFLTGVGIYFWLSDSSASQTNLLSIVPESGALIFQTKKPVRTWETVSNTKIWREFIHTGGFESYQETDSLLRIYLLENGLVKKILKDRPALISIHPNYRGDFHLLYAFDLKNTKQTKKLSQWLIENLGEKWEIQTQKVYNHKVYSIKGETTWFFGFTGNMLIVSSNRKLLLRALDRPKQTYLKPLEHFKEIENNLAPGLLTVWINYRNLPAFASVFFENAKQELSPLTRQFVLSGLTVEQQDRLIWAEGFTHTDSVPSYFNALLDVKPGKLRAAGILPEATAFYFSLAFKNFNLFKQSQEEFLKKRNPAEFNNYRSQIKQIERYLKIDLQRDFYDWIGQEILLAKLHYEGTKKIDPVLIIQTQDIEKAQKNLQFINRQIRKKTPFKFKNYDYNGYRIYFLKQKNFFKLFLGNWFKNIEQPYYTFIEDFVIFSNSENTLKKFIDNYKNKQLLRQTKDYALLNKELSRKAHLTFYVNMPDFFPFLSTLLTPETRKTIFRRKNLIFAFHQNLLQFTGNGSAYKTKILIDQGK